METDSGTRPIEPTLLSPTGLGQDFLDTDAVRAVHLLQRRGYEAYLVGGCVRDLFLGHKPKDFDIATSARPQQVKRTFPRNCRIIGRRFKLAHLHFHQNTKILEVSTFRRTPQDEPREGDDLLITQDNEFGTAEEDALRRDFTVNALFFDPGHDRILDYVGGLDDLRARVIRTIGDPVVRFREDPVRILRAAKFASRLGFHVDAPTLEAMALVAPDLVRSAPPRVLEEILRLLRSGHSLDSFQILRDIGAIKVILPVVGEFLGRAAESERVVFWRLLEALDSRVLRGAPPANPVLLGTVFARPVAAQIDPAGPVAPTVIAEEIVAPFAAALRLPRRDAGCLKRICGVQGRFRVHGKKRFKTASFLRDPYFAEALDLFALTCEATGVGYEDLDRWTALLAEDQPHAGAGPFPDEDEPELAESAEDLAPEAAADTETGGIDTEDATDQPAPAETAAPRGPRDSEDLRGLSRSARRRRRRRMRLERERGQPGAGPDEAREPEFTDVAMAADDAGAAPPLSPDEAAVAEAQPTALTSGGPESGEDAPRGRRRRRRGGRGRGRNREREFERAPAPGEPEATFAATAPQDAAAGESTHAPATIRAERPRGGEPRARQDRRPSREERRQEQMRRRDERRREKQVKVLEPETVDRSVFDVELDPTRIASFGAFAEGQQKKKRPVLRPLLEDDKDPYKPPPPPDLAPPPPAPEAGPDEGGGSSFGDW